jgi:hypothetical protein
MAAANASARAQHSAILASPLLDLTGFFLAVDCLARGCGGERSYAVAALASFYAAGPVRGGGRARNFANDQPLTDYKRSGGTNIEPNGAS